MFNLNQGSRFWDTCSSFWCQWSSKCFFSENTYQTRFLIFFLNSLNCDIQELNAKRILFCSKIMDDHRRMFLTVWLRSSNTGFFDIFLLTRETWRSIFLASFDIISSNLVPCLETQAKKWPVLCVGKNRSFLSNFVVFGAITSEILQNFIYFRNKDIQLFKYCSWVMIKTFFKLLLTKQSSRSGFLGCSNVFEFLVLYPVNHNWIWLIPLFKFSSRFSKRIVLISSINVSIDICLSVGVFSNWSSRINLYSAEFKM